MRRFQIWSVWVLLLAQVAWLGLQQQAPTAAHTDPVMRVEQDRTGLTFILEGHSPQVKPKLTVHGKADYATYLREPSYEGGTTRIRLGHSVVHIKLPVAMVSYTWEVGDKRYSGSYLAVHEAYPFDWKSKETEQFKVFYVDEKDVKGLAEWGEIYKRVAAYLGLKPEPRTIFVMPNAAAAQRMVQNNGIPYQVAGLWVQVVNALVIDGDTPQDTYMKEVVAHELAHSLLFSDMSPVWWEEGVARYIGLREDKSAMVAERRAALELQGRARRESISLEKVTRQTKAPLDPYTIGLSFVLYVRSRAGEAGLVKVMTETKRTNRFYDAMEEVLGEPLFKVEPKWLEYVRSEQYTIDMRTL